MHPDLEKLIALQAHDVEAKRLRDEMVALPKHVAALEAKAKATQGQRAVILDLIAKEEALRRRQESDVKDQQAKIARLARTWISPRRPCRSPRSSTRSHSPRPR
jgi:hypothetical protein